LSYNQKYLNFRKYKFRHTFSPPVQQLTTNMRILWRGITGPI
jgi:hypothetical protein